MHTIKTNCKYPSTLTDLRTSFFNKFSIFFNFNLKHDFSLISNKRHVILKSKSYPNIKFYVSFTADDMCHLPPNKQIK